MLLPFLNLLPESKRFLPAAGFCSLEICVTVRKVFKVALRTNSFLVQILMTFFYFNIPFQVSIGKLRLSWGGEKIWWESRSLIMEKPECWGSLATIPHSTPPDPQLQLELLSSLQNLIIYHKMDINKSAWINP